MIVITVNRPGLDVIGVARGKPYLKKKGGKKKKLDSSALTRGKIALIQQWVLRSEVTHFSLKATLG